MSIPIPVLDNIHTHGQKPLKFLFYLSNIFPHLSGHFCYGIIGKAQNFILGLLESTENP